VRAGYAARAAADPGRFVQLQAGAEPPTVWQQVQAAVEARPWW
jgi:dTMP kinase